ncbi:MAG: alpha/beta hydrolase [Flavobacteriia bacterium]|uniref:Alpha/beta hydrolase n=2 Tax=Flavobacteriaceae TaxID=49546 RepID=A0A5N5IUW2_9FLAO|nr:alpha/beta hydrolase [Allomuricauda hadalis]RUA15218.1 MAG: alpha/beta hydrolase [Flavobacteriia bacterium]
MRYIVSILFLWSFHLCMAQNHTMPLWEGEIPNAKKSDLQEEQKNAQARVISKVIEPSLEVYLPSSVIKTGKMVMICPGGGYGVLAYDKEGTDIAKWLNGYGIAAAVLKYRLPEDGSNEIPHLTPLMDAKRGVELIRSNAEKWGIDPNKVGVMGFSAGGHLASTLGTHFEEGNRPNFMALIYPVVTMKQDHTHNGSRKNLLGPDPSDNLVEHYSNELQVRENTPPTFILHSTDDEVVPLENSLQLAKSLKDKGISVEMHVYPYGGHGFAMALQQGRLSKWGQLLLDWLSDI